MNFRFKKAELGVFNTESAKPAIEGFRHKCRLMGVTRGKFSLIDLIHEVLQKTGVADVICVTWSAGIKDAHQVEWMVRTGLINSFRIITDRSYPTRQPKYAISLEDLFGKENIFVSDIHAKIVLISNEKYKVVMRTSMNLNANATCENFEIDENKEIYDFYFKFFNKIITETPESGWDGRRSVVSAVLDRVFGEKLAAEKTLDPGELRLNRIKRRMAEA